MASERRILCAGRNQRNQELLSGVLNKAGYAAEIALSCEDIMPTVESSSIMLVLLDITGFDERVWPVCRGLKSRNIPFFIITAPNRTHMPAGYSAPLTPLLVKPLSIRPLLTLIARTL